MEEGDFFRPSSVSPGGEGFNNPSQVIRWHLACIFTVVLCGDEICAPLCPMMASGVVLDEIVYQIMFFSHPIYQKLSLPESVSDPVNFYIDGSWTSLTDVVIDKSVSCGAVHHCWIGWLRVAHLYERHAHSLNYPTVLKKGPQFFFHCASKDVSHGHKFNTNWSIEWRLIEGGIVGICWCRDEVMISPRSAIGFRLW